MQASKDSEDKEVATSSAAQQSQLQKMLADAEAREHKALKKQDMQAEHLQKARTDLDGARDDTRKAMDELASARQQLARLLPPSPPLDSPQSPSTRSS